jgi:putative hydrolases of HD superfamily
MATTQLNLQDMIRFSQLILRFQNVVRAIHLPDRAHKENDAEHSYHLAMMAWYLNSSAGLGLDTDRLVRYALAHDLVEAYAGDVNALDLEARRYKAHREAEALRRIKYEFPEATELVSAVVEYELLSDEEARFIYALDKLMPALMIYLDGGRTWLENGQSYELIQRCQADRIALSDPVNRLYEQLCEILTSRPELFSAGRPSDNAQSPSPQRTSSPPAYRPRRALSALPL